MSSRVLGTLLVICAIYPQVTMAQIVAPEIDTVVAVVDSSGVLRVARAAQAWIDWPDL